MAYRQIQPGLAGRGGRLGCSISYPIFQQPTTTRVAELTVQDDAGTVVGFVDFDVGVAGGNFEGWFWDL